MTKSATEIMNDIISAAVIDSIMALKSASKGMPNTLLRDLGAIHANTAVADLPKELQAAITASVRAAFTRLQKEGYIVSSGSAPPPRAPVRREPAEGRKPPPGGPRNRTPRPRR